MDHKLRPVVRMDDYMRSATIELHGCLTVPATSALLKLLTRGRSLSPRLALGLDLRHARHIEEDCLQTLQVQAVAAGARELGNVYELDAVIGQLGPVKVTLPRVWPVCPVERVLSGKQLRELHI